MPTGSEPTAEQVATYDGLRARGRSQRQAASEVGLSAAWASRRDASRSAEAWVPVVPSAEAQLLLDDFEAFRAAYLGHVSKAWMVEAADTVRRLLASPQPEFLVINIAPGCGKSTFLQDLFTWLLCRDRSIRTIYGADTEDNAKKATGLIQSFFEAQSPVPSSDALVAAGQAVKPTRVLADDFGSFKGDGLWTRGAFDILGKAAVKEPSVTAFGRGGGVMGNRAELVGWDDLVTEEITRSATANERLAEDWDGGLGESRLEPFGNGLAFLVGQRIGPRDLFRYNLDKRYVEIIDGEEVEHASYTHIVFPAHFDDICIGVHDKTVARSWPMGCLLDADRLPWGGPKGLAAKKRNSPRAYEVQYQQQEGTGSNALIENAWIFGGVDSEGVDRPGCLNRGRLLGEVPKDWDASCTSMVTVDPSGTQYWAIEWWLSNPGLNASALMRLHNRKMQSNQLLDWDGEHFTGLLEDLWHESVAVNRPITNVVVEINAAQRYLLTTHAVKKWREARKVAITPHTTARNKSDPELGLPILVEPFRQGWFDLPYGDVASRAQTVELANQLCSYSDRDDLKMACWFHRLWFYQLIRRTKALPTLPRPSWLSGSPRKMFAAR